jgi:DNA repair protein RecO (recombination protein O)
MSTHDQAYIIYNAHYQESSALVKLLTRENGLISAVVRGVHHSNKKSNGLRAAVQLGNLVECQWSGKTSLKTIYQMDLVQPAVFDTAEKFICLAYIHELLLFFLHEEFHIDKIFAEYAGFIENILGSDVEWALRTFEFNLLENLGYGIDFSRVADDDMPVEAEKKYQVIPGLGVMHANDVDVLFYSGSDLLSMHHKNYNNPLLLSTAKKISRSLLAYHMEGRPIKARQLYRELFGQ